MCKIVSIARLSRGKRGITKGTIDIYREINIRCAYVLNRQQPCGPPGVITNKQTRNAPLIISCAFGCCYLG